MPSLKFWEEIQQMKWTNNFNNKFGPLLKGHLYSGERWHFFLAPKLEFYLHSGDTLALKKWLTTKIIDMFKCTQVTMANELSHLNWCTALVEIQHTTLQRQVNHDFLYII